MGFRGGGGQIDPPPPAAYPCFQVPHAAGIGLSALYIKQIKNIMKYQLNANASKKINDYRL